MLVKNQKVEVSWHPSTRKHYEELGYKFTKYRDIFTVPAEQLSKGSEHKVEVMCDYCENVIIKQWYHYQQSLNDSIIQKDACNSCKTIKGFSNTQYRTKKKVEKTNLLNSGRQGYNHKTPLTEDEVVDILDKRYMEDKTYSEIAKTYGKIGEGAVSRLCRGKTHKKITIPYLVDKGYWKEEWKEI